MDVIHIIIITIIIIINNNIYCRDKKGKGLKSFKVMKAEKCHILSC